MTKHLTKVQVLLLGAALATAALVLVSTSWAQPAGPPPHAGPQHMGPGMGPGGPPPGGPHGFGPMHGRGGPGQGMMPQAGSQGRRGGQPGFHQGQMQRGPAGAKGGHGRGWEGGRMPDLWNHPEVQKKLELTDDQVKALQEKRLKLETQRIKVEADLEIARLKLEGLIEQSELDKEAIDAQIEKLGELHGKQIRGMVNQKLALREILNEEQLEKVDDFITRMRTRRFEQVRDRWQDRRATDSPGRERATRGRDRGERKERADETRRGRRARDDKRPASDSENETPASEEAGSNSSE